jgi:hypothetical protein
MTTATQAAVFKTPSCIENVKRDFAALSQNALHTEASGALVSPAWVWVESACALS